jgi:hypothetical protein
MNGPTLQDIMSLPDDNEVKKALLNAGIGTEYDAFCERVEDAVLQGVIHMENNKPQFSSLGEDTLTGILAYGLQMKGFSADHDTYRNGHCDLLVKEGAYEWFGEAKLDKGPKYTLEGFRQLCDRYAPGGGFSRRGGLIVYTDKQNKIRVLEAWVKKIQSDYERPTVFSPVCKQTLTSKSTHSHPATGLDFIVRHYPISFYHKPTDKSARSRKGGA